MNPFPSCIVSGGQTGADRAGLDFAMAHGLTHAGFCPRGRLAEDGPISSVYNLTETASASYPERTRRNVLQADATIIFASQPAERLLLQRRGGGSALTAREAIRANRPYCVLCSFPVLEPDVAALHAFLNTHRPRVLNVAGSRESTLPGIGHHVVAVLTAVAALMPGPVSSPCYSLAGHTS